MREHTNTKNGSIFGSTELVRSTHERSNGNGSADFNRSVTLAKSDSVKNFTSWSQAMALSIFVDESGDKRVIG